MKSMKLFFLCAILGALTFYACTESTTTETTTPTPTESSPKVVPLGGGPVLDTVPLQEAQGWANDWKTVVTAAGIPVVYGYTLPLVDLKEVLGEKADSARLYLGKIEKTGEYKIVILGVDSLGNDMLDSTATPAEYIYDISRPCPPDCGAFIQ